MPAFFGRVALGAALLLAESPRSVFAQERGAIAVGQAVQGLGVNTRVLLIGAHPDDEDTFLISWLSRGRLVTTAYLSLTRGDGGQNLIGNELGEALGVIRTEELLAARRVDGALQYFTRAYDFGFSKDTIDTYKHWQRDSILGDVVRVIRAFRPHVIVAVFSGTPRDGHGHHQVSGLLGRVAYDAANDTVRFPTAAYGPSWAPLKFYRNARYDPTGGETLRFDVGEYSPLLGLSYAEIAGQSRSQHKSQGFGTPQRKGPFFDALRRESSRVNQSTAASAEASIFDGIDTTWARFRPSVTNARARAALDSLSPAFAAIRDAFDPFEPRRLVAPLMHLKTLLFQICPRASVTACGRAELQNGRAVGGWGDVDLYTTARVAQERVNEALELATGAAVEAIADREAYPVGGSARAVASVYNRGTDTLSVSSPLVLDGNLRAPEGSVGRLLPPGALLRDTVLVHIDSVTQPWWLTKGRVGAMFALPGSGGAENLKGSLPTIEYSVGRAGAHDGVIELSEPVIFRFADQVKGEVRRQIAGAPAISVTLDQQVQYAPANTEFAREIDVHLRSADEKPRDVRVTLALPRGISSDSATRTARLAGYDATQRLTFRLRGRLPAGEHRITASVQSDGQTYGTGYQLIDYDHIRRQRIYRPATTVLSSVEMRVPSTLRVAYVAGVGDNVAPMLAQLGIPVTVFSATDLARADLQPYTTIVIGPRAYEAHRELVSANTRVFDFARKGGTVVVQYGQYEMTRPGVMPFPITLARPADRVTEEDSPVTIDAPDDKLLRSPNRIVASDFAGWVQERALYMPRTFDSHYRSLLSMNDAGEPPNKGAILVMPLGEGVYIYTTLSIFRQLPAGVPGGARLFLNLLSAGIASPIVNP